MDKELINQIVQQVLAAMGRQGQTAAPVPAASASPSAVSGPAREAKPAAAKGSGNGAASATGAPKPAVLTYSQRMKLNAPVVNGKGRTKPEAPKRVFITAEMLIQRAAGSRQAGVIELAYNEYLTPNAEDLADKKHLTVQRAAKGQETCPGGVCAAMPSGDAAATVSATAPSASSSTTTATAQTSAMAAMPSAASAAAGNGQCAIGLLVERADQKVDAVISSVGGQLSLVNYTHSDCWRQNLRALCQAIAAGAVCAGIAILPYGAGAMLLANKFKGVRAVQGTRAASVDAAMRHFAANLLVLEHAFSTFHEMRMMAQMFAARPAAAPADKALVEAVAEQEK